jgi:hypothetical protein
MASSPFERLVAEKMEEVKTALLGVPAGDSCKIAHVQGTHAGLALALELHRKAIGPDEDQDEV